MNKTEFKSIMSMTKDPILIKECSQDIAFFIYQYLEILGWKQK